MHPSVQVGQYKKYLLDSHTAFYEKNPILLNALAYLHNYTYEASDAIYDIKFKEAMEDSPIFTSYETQKLIDFLQLMVGKGEGETVLERIEQSKYRPSKKLMNHVGNVIKNKSEYVLLDEQLIVYDKVFVVTKSSLKDDKKHVVIVKGGPGTGKSVIAINLMADLLLKGYDAQYATGSRAFTETLRKVIGSRGSVQFKYFNSYMDATNNQIDVLISDEAHRIRETSNNRFTRKEKRSGLFQIEELLRAARVNVFFIDDKQIVRPNEIGSVDYIKENAAKFGYEVHEYELEAQFRCGGSDGFVNWIDNTLDIQRTANVIWDTKEEFDFRIVDSPYELEGLIKARVSDGNTGRIVAGFCWDWSDPNKDGTLVEDVIIGDYKRPWNAKSTAGKLARDIPKESLWANDPNGLNQIGCIYTAQGFEFDYVSVIIGNDLTYNFDNQEWEGNKEYSKDGIVKRSKEQFIDLIKNSYRVLLTRGMKGCYVYFLDKDTRNFFRSRME